MRHWDGNGDEMSPGDIARFDILRRGGERRGNRGNQRGRPDGGDERFDEIFHGGHTRMPYTSPEGSGVGGGGGGWDA